MVFYCLKYLAYVKGSPSYIKYCNVHLYKVLQRAIDRYSKATGINRRVFDY